MKNQEKLRDLLYRLVFHCNCTDYCVNCEFDSSNDECNLRSNMSNLYTDDIDLLCKLIMEVLEDEK